MAEENVELSVASEETESCRVEVRSYSAGKASSENSNKKVVSRYLKPSTGSCHDICKFGRENAIGTKERRSIPDRATRKKLYQSSEGGSGGIMISVSGLSASADSKPSKKSLSKLEKSVDSELQVSDTSDSKKQELPMKSSDNKKETRNEGLIKKNRTSLVKVKPPLLESPCTSSSARQETSSTAKEVESSSESAVKKVENPSKSISETMETSSKSIFNKVETPSKSTLDEVETPSKSDSKNVKTPSESCSKKVETPSKSISNKVETPSKSISEEVETPSESNSKKVKTQSESISEKVETPSKSTSNMVKTPSKSTLEEVETTSKSDSKKVKTPSASISEKVETPSKSTSNMVETPSKSTSDGVETPSESNSKKVKTPYASISKKVETPSKATSNKVETPSKSTSEGVETSSESNAKVKSPSESTSEKVETPKSTSNKVETPSKSTSNKVETPSKSNLEEVETPSKSNSKVKIPSEPTSVKVETPSKSTSNKVETPSKSTSEEVETPSKSNSKKVKVPFKSTSKKMGTGTPLKSTSNIKASSKSTSRVETSLESTARMVKTPSKPYALKGNGTELSAKSVTSLKPISFPRKITSLNSSKGFGGQRNSDIKMEKETVLSKAASRKLMKPLTEPLSPKVFLKSVRSIDSKKHKSLKIVSQLKNQQTANARKVDPEELNNDEVEEKTLYVIKMESENKTFQSDHNSSYNDDPFLPQISAPNFASSSKFQPLSQEGQEESEYTITKHKEDSVSLNHEEYMENGKTLEVVVKGKQRKGGIVYSEDKDDIMLKVKFRKGRMIENKIESNSPRRLQFRKTKGYQKAYLRYDSKRKNFKRRDEACDDSTGATPGPEYVILRHQDKKDKKGAQGLFNIVIEETASKLAETRKSKVKALVGAFETVISLQDEKPSSNTAT